MWREALDKLQDTLWADVLMRHSFTGLGAAQFARDTRAISALVDAHVTGAGSAALATLEDAARVLSLPLDSAETSAQQGEEDLGAGEEKVVMSLRQASDRFFVDNTEAKRALEDLGIDSLTPANARNIVQRRVEYQD